MAITRLDAMIDAAINRKDNHDIETLIIPSHMAQMRLFAIRQGVELYPAQDTPDRQRKTFIDRLWRQNKMARHLPRMLDLLMGKGSLLIYLRPTQDSYKIHYYYASDSETDTQFKDYYDSNGDLIEVVIIYSYFTKSDLTLPSARRWIKIRITKEAIYQSETEVKPSFSNIGDLEIGETKLENTLGFIPCVVCKNYPSESGLPGADEFSWLAGAIIRHDRLIATINDNMEFFGNPTLVTTRSEKEVTESAIAGNKVQSNIRPSMGSQGSWVDPLNGTGSSRVDDPRFRPGNIGQKLKRVIGGVEADERFGYIHPDPVSPDHHRHAAMQREQIRTALGGVDELGITTGATAFELKSLYGRAAATALQKAREVFEYGLCEIFEMAIYNEEQMFRRAVASMLEEDPAVMTDEYLNQLFEEEKVPTNIGFGLSPYGDRTVKWRWTGPVFEDSPRDILDKSIVGRNLREEGVNTEEILRFIYPDRTDQEIAQLIDGGYPYRYISSIAGTTGQLLALYRELLSVPAPIDPNLPFGAAFPPDGFMNLIGVGLDRINTEAMRSYSARAADQSDNPQKLTPLQDGNQPTNAGSGGSTPGDGSGASPNTELLPGISGRSFGSGLSQPSSGDPTVLPYSGYDAFLPAGVPATGSYYALGIPGIDPATGQPIPAGQPTQSVQQPGQPVGSVGMAADRGVGNQPAIDPNSPALPTLPRDFEYGIPAAGSAVGVPRQPRLPGVYNPAAPSRLLDANGQPPLPWWARLFPTLAAITGHGVPTPGRDSGGKQAKQRHKK